MLPNNNDTVCDVPFWAIDRACLFIKKWVSTPPNPYLVWNYPDIHPSVMCLAELIVKYEKPPVDPTLLKARQILQEISSKRDGTLDWLSGDMDDSFAMVAVVKALKG